MSAGPRLVTRWTSQADRCEAAPPNPAGIDTRTLAERLAQLVRHAAAIPFVDGKAADAEGVEAARSAADNWADVLLADRSLALASLAGDLDTLAAGLDAALADLSVSPAAPESGLGAVLTLLLDLSEQLDRNLALAETGPARELAAFRERVEHAIGQRLGPLLQALWDVAELAAHLHRPDSDPDRLELHRWRWRALHPRWRHETGGAAETDMRVRFERLTELAGGLTRELQGLKDQAAAALELSLAAGDHAPHAALAIGFAQLFRHVQASMNLIPRRLLHFRLEQVVRPEPGGATVDQVLLTLTPRAGLRPTLPQGLLVAAGRDGAGRPVAFALDAPLQLTGARLKALRVWRPNDAGCVTASQFAAGPGGAVGDAAAGIAAPATATPATSTLFVSTIQLALAVGRRRIALTLAAPGIKSADGLKAVDVSVSTAQGWRSAPAPQWTVAGETVTVVTVLAPDFPPLAPLPPPPGQPPDGPGLRLTLDGAAMAALDPGGPLSLSLAVKDVQGLAVRTPAGPASAAAAAPFGAPPFAGGWLRIDHPALAGPPLDKLVLQFDWTSLPSTGFAGYYRGYVVDETGALLASSPFDNAAFQVALSAPVKGWDPTRTLPLFAAAPAPPAPDVFIPDTPVPAPVAPAEGPLAPSTWLAAWAGAAGSAGLPDHLTITLAGPLQAFGAALYPLNVHAATEAIARSAAATSTPAPPPPTSSPTAASPPPSPVRVAPNPPYQPLLSNIRLDYALTLERADLTVRQVTFGSDLAPPEPAPGGSPAMPVPAGAPSRPAAAAAFAPPPDRVTLDIGLQGARAGEVQSLLVRLGASAPAPGRTLFGYLARDGWRALPPDTLQADRTGGLTATGLIRFATPADTLEADQTVWLRAVFGDEMRAPPPIVAITANGVSATRSLGGGDGSQAPAAAGTITRLAGVPAVAEVSQPFASTGGRPSDSSEALRQRTVERLRHRGRALTSWDMERLILAEFPDVARVRVLGVSAPKAPLDGALTVLVVPVPAAADDPVRPRASPLLCSAIAVRLRPLASPFARLEVTSPAYVPVDVSALLEIEGADTATLQDGLAALLSPWAEPGLSQDGSADVDGLRAAIAGFLLRQPQVQAISRLKVVLHEAGDAPCTALTAGAIAIAAVASRQKAPAW